MNLYCTVAGFISVWAVSGLLVLVDYVSGTPAGTFFALIGISLGINDPVLAQYVDFGLHLLTGIITGNVYGQASIFWRKIAPRTYRHGILTGLIVGFALWTVLFVSLGKSYQGVNGLLISIIPVFLPSLYITF